MARLIPSAEDPASLVAWLRIQYAPGTPVGDDCTAVDVRATLEGATLLVRFERDPRLYGIPIAFDDLEHDFFYQGFAVASVEEWLESVTLGLMVHLGTGLRCTAARTLVGDHVELRPEGGWPHDRRIWLQVDPPGGDDVAARVTSYADGRPTRVLARAVVRWEGEGRTTGRLELDQLLEADAFVVVDLAHLAAHVAAEAGATRVRTRLALAELRLAGFLGDPREPPGSRSVDPSFLDVDPAGAARLLAGLT